MSSEAQVTTNILLVDDQPQNLLALEAILEPLGQNLVRATSGAEALKHILKQDFSVILLDVQMPGMDGFETATLIKERERSRHIPIIFLTAISKDERYVFKGYTVGAVDYMFKPFDAEVLRSKVSVFIDLFRKNERVKAQAELLRIQGERDLADLRRESEHRYRTLAESMPQIVWTADPKGRLTYGNRRFFDCASAPARGEGQLDFRAVLHPDDTAPFIERWRAGVEAQQTYEAEFRFGSARAGGYRWHLVRALPLRSDSGQVTSWIGTSTDIDDRRRAEDVLRFLADASRVLSSSLDHESALARVARLAVPAVADLCWVDLLEGGSTIRRLSTVHGAGEEAPSGAGQRWPLDAGASAGSSRVLATGARELLTEVLPEQLSALTGGAHAPLSLERATSSICVPVVSRGRALGAITLVTTQSGRRFGPSELASIEDLALRAGVAVDNATLYALAQRERAKLEEANRAKDEFLATLSHELRTPLNAILGWTHLLRDGQLDGPSADRALETIERNAKAQAQLIADLLDVSRIVTGKLHLSMRLVKLSEILEAALDAVQLSAQAKSIALERALASDGCEVRGDPDRLQQVVSNLLSNAVKFTPKGGTIRVVLERDGGRATVRVIDNGQGIAKDFLPFVFDRFRQADSTSTRVHGGLGLGLAIARHLIELHGGTVGVESEGKGLGATFSVSIPLAEADDEAVPRSLRRAAGGAHAIPEIEMMHVLVVDDDSDGREMLRVVLQQRGARVTSVGTAAEAVAVIERDRPDVLLCDIGLPGEDGYSLIRRVRELPGGDAAALPAAALTAYASLQDRDRALAAGFQAHLPKPINPDDLMAVLVTFVRQRTGAGRP